MTESEIVAYVEKHNFRKVNSDRNNVKVYERDDLGKDWSLLITHGKVGFQFCKEHDGILECYTLSFGAVLDFIEGLPFFLSHFHNHPFVAFEFNDKAPDSFSGGIVGWMAVNKFFLQSPSISITAFPSFYKKHDCDSIFSTTRLWQDEESKFELVFDSKDMRAPKYVEVMHERKKYFSTLVKILVTESVSCVVPYSENWKNKEIFYWAWEMWGLEKEDYLSKLQQIKF